MNRQIFLADQRRPSTWLAPLVAAAVAGLALTGCFPRETHYTIPENTAYSVGESEYSFASRFDAGSVALSDIEKRRLSGFVNEVRPGGNDTIVVAASGSLAEARRRVVENTLAEFGVYGVTMVEGIAGGDNVTVTVARTVPIPVACLPAVSPGFSDQALFPPVGCANALNLARMVAYQDDLIDGGAIGPADSTAMTGSVSRYRANQVTTVEAEGTN